MKWYKHVATDLFYFDSEEQTRSFSIEREEQGSTFHSKRISNRDLFSFKRKLDIPYA
jgi:hypothetical protein